MGMGGSGSLTPPPLGLFGGKKGPGVLYIVSNNLIFFPTALILKGREYCFPFPIPFLFIIYEFSPSDGPGGGGYAMHF